MSIYRRAPLKRGTEHQSHSNIVQKRIRTVAILGSALLGLGNWVADNTVENGVALRERISDFARSSNPLQTSSTEETMQAALKKALGKDIQVRCADIHGKPDNAFPTTTGTVGYTYKGWMNHPRAIRLTPKTCEAIADIPSMSKSPRPDQMARDAEALTALTYLAIENTETTTDKRELILHTLQKVGVVAEGLGASPDAARDLSAYIARPLTEKP